MQYTKRRIRWILCAVFCAVTVPAKSTPNEIWKMQPVLIQTRWATSVSPANALPEYPRPQMVRPRWQNLNGLWRYAITEKDASAPILYDGNILVPYPIESALSGVGKPLKPDQLLWYQRSFGAKSQKNGARTLLHFGAVDYQATVYLNGREVGIHRGGYQSFTFDISDALKDGDNELVVRVLDPTDTGLNTHGKQTLDPKGAMYTASSGIWQTVWLETVPRTYIRNLTMTSDVDREQLHLQVHLEGDREGYVVEAIARSGSTVVAKQGVNGLTALTIPRPHLWSPEDPFLYDLEVRLIKNGRVVDEVGSYFGMRKIEVKKDAKGQERIYLNNQYTYNLGVLDQGFWPEGLYTAPTDAALKFDIEAIKSMGFNTIRKHIKIEPARWYYHCDTLGMLVWQDMVPPAGAWDQPTPMPEARARFEVEMEENIAQLHNYPSITTWVLFNEGWGDYDQDRLVHRVKELDPSRLINGHSGAVILLKGQQVLLSGTAGVETDLLDIHSYPNPAMIYATELVKGARVLGEYGGVGVTIDGHVWNAPGGWGYIQVTREELAKTYAGMIAQLKDLEAQGLTGSIYTQPFDVETELNGLMTYDREVMKIPQAELARMNRFAHH